MYRSLWKRHTDRQTDRQRDRQMQNASTHKWFSLFISNFSFMSRCKWIAMFGTRRIGRLMSTRRCSTLSPDYSNHSHACLLSKKLASFNEWNYQHVTMDRHVKSQLQLRNSLIHVFLQKDNSVINLCSLWVYTVVQGKVFYWKKCYL